MSKSKNISMRHFLSKGVLFLVFFFFVGVISIKAEGGKVDVSALIQETQKMSTKADEMTMVWWIPEEFWEASFAQNATIPKSSYDEIIKVLRPYTIIVVVDGTLGTFGGATYQSEADIRSKIQLRDGEGNLYYPVSEGDIGADIKNFLSMMKPMMASILGPMGENMHFFLFPSENKKGQKLIEAKKDGTFSVELGKREFRWRLPLGSLLAPKVCPTCEEKLSGAYKFCPFDGTKLPENEN